jgi:DNA-binding XRE family transcriptional regulator
VSERIVEESELAALAKSFRESAGKNRAEAARELKVAAPTLHQAEEEPARSLQKLRKQIIEKYSDYEIVGPVYLLQKKK